MKQPKFRVVGEDEPSPSELLAGIVPELVKAEREVARLRNELALAGRLLAKQRRVAFIREEHLRREFGGDDL